MAEVTLEEVPQKVRDLFNKGFAAFERGNIDYAIDLLMACVKAEPRFLHARKFLTAAEMQRFKKKGNSPVNRLLASLANLPDKARAKVMLASGNADKALPLVEAMLKRNPMDLNTLMMFAQAMEGKEIPEAAIQMLLIAREANSNNIPLLKMLGRLYERTEQVREAREIYEKLDKLCPKDGDVIKALKNVTALDSMHKGGWVKAAEEGEDFRKVMKDTKEAELMEQQSKLVKDVKDVDNLISDMLKKIEAEPGNINYIRHLSRLYADKKDFDAAVNTLLKAMELNPGDPELDNTRSSLVMKKFEYEITELRAAGDNEAADAKEAEKTEFAFNDLQERVKRYPNDLRLHFQWGCALYENDYTDEAIMEFQKAQRNVQNRHMSLFYMAMCFKKKKQYDMAMEQLTMAAGEMVAMDDVKKGVLYELGEIQDLTGNPQKAFEFYKQVYQADAGYKDIRQKVEKAYDANQG